jgi:long-chain acyl-CoA synthetase
MGLRPDWPNLGVISLAYSYGFSSLVLPLLLHGIPLFLVPSPLPVACAARPRALEPHRRRRAGAVARLAQGRRHPAQRAPGHLGGRAAAAHAGAAVFEEHGVKIHNFYGSTECGGIAYDATDDAAPEESSVGRPLKNVKVSEIGDGRRACWCAAGPWAKPIGRSRKTSRWAAAPFRTCDLAELRDGEIYLRGRTRRPHQRGRTKSFAGHHRTGVAGTRCRRRVPRLWRAQRQRGPH